MMHGLSLQLFVVAVFPEHWAIPLEISYALDS